MTMTIEETLEAMEAILTESEDRSLTDDEVETYEGLESDLAGARRTMELRSRHAAYLTPVGSPVPVATGVQDDDDTTLERAFDHYLRTGVENADLVELRAQSVGTDTAGGFTVPPGFRNKLVDRMVAFSGLANVVETITTDTGVALPWPTLDDTANQGEIAAEGAAGVGGNDLVFGELVLGAHKYTAPGADNTGSDPLRVSVELLQDSAFDIAGMVARKLGERIARKQAVDWVTGPGTTAPLGIDTAGALQTFAGAAPTHSELVDAVHSVDPAYRMNAKWVFNDQTLAEIRKLEDSQGRPLWQSQANAGLENMPGGVLLGHQVVIDQAFADYTDASSNVWGVFGDVFEGYVIRRVANETLIVDPYTRAANGQVLYTVWSRADGTPQNPNSYSRLQNDAV